VDTINASILAVQRRFKRHSSEKRMCFDTGLTALYKVLTTWLQIHTRDIYKDMKD